MWDFPNAIYLQAEVWNTLKQLLKNTESTTAIIAQLDGARALTNTMLKTTGYYWCIILSIIIRGKSSHSPTEHFILRMIPQLSLPSEIQTLISWMKYYRKHQFQCVEPLVRWKHLYYYHVGLASWASDGNNSWHIMLAWKCRGLEFLVIFSSSIDESLTIY